MNMLGSDKYTVNSGGIGVVSIRRPSHVFQYCTQKSRAMLKNIGRPGYKASIGAVKDYCQYANGWLYSS